MIIYNNNPYQGLQNAMRPGGLKASSSDHAQVTLPGRVQTIGDAQADAVDRLLIQITERINTLQRNLDLTLVHYPPFFPIATYQRMDMIMEIKGIGEDIGKAPVDPALKQLASSAKTLSPESTDSDIADTLDKLLSVRDTLVKERAAVKKELRPGTILALEI
jgi:hypothetical protein